MPPKKHAAPPKEEIDESLLLPPRLTPQDIQADWEDTTSGEYFCRVIVNRVVADMEDEIVRAHMDHTAVPWTVQSVLTDLMESIQLNFIEREQGQVTEEDPADVECSISEPPVTDPDSWARASMLQRTPLVRADAEQFAPKVVVKERRPVGGIRTAAAGDSPASAAATPLGAGMPGPSRLNSAGHSTSSSMNHAHSSFNPGASTNPSGGRPRRGSVSQRGSVHSETEALDVMLRTEEEVKQLERQRLASERMSHLRSVAERLNKQFSEIRNVNQTSIVIDGKTNSVLQVSKPDPRKLPHAAEPKIRVELDSAEAAAAAAALAAEKEKANQSNRSRAGLGGGSTYVPRPDDKKNKSKKPDSSNFFVPEVQSNPMVVGVQPSAGVQSKEGDAVKRSEYKAQKSKISRQEFSKVMAMQQQTQRMAGANLGYDGLGGEMGGFEGMSGPSAPIGTGLKRTASMLGSIGGGPTSPGGTQANKSAVKAALSSGSGVVVGNGGKHAKIVMSTPKNTNDGPQLHKKKTRPASSETLHVINNNQHTAKHRSPMRPRGGEIPVTLPLNNPPERARTPMAGARINPIQIPRDAGHAPLRDITLKARASTPDMVQLKEKVKQFENQPSGVMRIAQQEGGEPGEVSDLAAEFFSDLIPHESTSFASQ